MVFDFEKEFEEIYAYLLRRVRKFDPAKDSGPVPGLGEGLVRRIDFGFQCDQDFWVALVFDRRLRAKPDGEWTRFLPGNSLARPAWKRMANSRTGGTLRMPEFVLQTLTAKEKKSEDLVVYLGVLLKCVLLKARAEGVFQSLPKAAKCCLGVEELNGGYGWPKHADRGKRDLV